jgi:predicted RNase H-like HicB family nuclease
MKTLSIPLRVVLYKEQADWIAHCLEFDVCGDGTTKKQALQSMAIAIQIQIEQSIKHGNSKNLFSPADGQLFQMFAAGKQVAIGKLPLRIKGMVIEATDARKYSDDLADSDLVHA